MRKTLALLGALLLAASMSQAAYAGGSSRVAYTFTYTDLGQGVWGGGSLFADGSAGGNVAFSADNGQTVYQLHPTSWSEPVPGYVDVCLAVREMKGSSGFPPSFCLSDLGLLLPVTGTPIVIPDPFEPGESTLIRVTPAN
ncbi:MAG: hypothetical protein M0Z49_00575 [Chloroflexi bacterium]|nr:hypothetical protein [Chloroflexota bacterium]